MINRRQRFKIDAVKPAKQNAQQRVYNFNEVSQPYTPETAMEQAQRQQEVLRQLEERRRRPRVAGWCGDCRGRTIISPWDR